MEQRRLYVVINSYNEEEMLPDCLKSIDEYLPFARVVVVDGAYKPFNDNAKVLAAQFFEEGHDKEAEQLLKYTFPQSLDHSQEIAMEHGIYMWIPCRKDKDGNWIAWDSEHQKRSQYFVGKTGDWYLMIDADERLHGSLPTFDILDKSPHWCIPLLRDDQKNPYPVLRVHSHADGMHYDGAHHALFWKDQLIRRQEYEDNFTLDSCFLAHLWCERGKISPLRHQAKGQYYRWLDVAEHKFRTTNSV